MVSLGMPPSPPTEFYTRAQINRAFGLFGLAGQPHVVSTDLLGWQTVDDGTGNLVVNDTTGATQKYMLDMGQKVAWLQPPVYIAAGVGLALGVLGFIAYSRRK